MAARASGSDGGLDGTIGGSPSAARVGAGAADGSGYVQLDSELCFSREALANLAKRRRRHPMRMPEWVAHAAGSSGSRPVSCGTPALSRQEPPTPARSVLAPSASPYLPRSKAFDDSLRTPEEAGSRAETPSRASPRHPGSLYKTRSRKATLGRGRSRLSAIHAPALLVLCDLLGCRQLRKECVRAIAARHSFLS